MRWKLIGFMAATILAIAFAVYGATLWELHARRAANPPPALTPLFTGYVGTPAFSIDPIAHCTVPQKDLRLALKPLSKGFLDSSMRGNADCIAISERMQPGDTIYAYSHESQAPPGMHDPDDFAGHSEGYIVLRGHCLIGMIGTLVE